MTATQTGQVPVPPALAQGGERRSPDAAPSRPLYSITRAFDPWSQLPVLPGAGRWDVGAA